MVSPFHLVIVSVKILKTVLRWPGDNPSSPDTVSTMKADGDRAQRRKERLEKELKEHKASMGVKLSRVWPSIVLLL